MEQKNLKKLPLGLSDFGEIITGNYVYVDKTKYIYDMITTGKYYFLSRPRRFGKSLLVSTLHAIFAGKKELFKDLLIASSDHDWQEYPVIKFDFSAVSDMSAHELETWIMEELQDQADDHEIDLSVRSTIAGRFSYLIKQLAQRNKVVVLIDEYDKPILDHLAESREAIAQRKVLKKLYSVLKGKDAYLRFVLLTGVSKFSKTSIFSGINNLHDITLSTKFGALLGYTHTELTHYFADHINYFAHEYGHTFDTMVQLLRDRYDGYQFAQNSPLLFNPFSILTSLLERSLGNYWFSTGTPTFVINLLKRSECPLDRIYDPAMRASELDAFEPDQIKITALLYQSGYLTIKNYVDSKYTLDFPNYEVADGFNMLVSTSFTGLTQTDTHNYSKSILHALKESDMLEFLQTLQDFFNQMPYDAHITEEYDLKIVLFSVFKIIGIEVDTEVKTRLGRADIIVELPKRVYIIELKFDGSAHAALEQIQDKKYYEKYLNTDRQITLLGLNFASKDRSVSLKAHSVLE